MDMRYKTAVAAMKALGSQALLELTKDDIKFIQQATLWLMPERSRARRIVESIAFGAVETCGLPRFPLPAEFVATVIAVFVNPSNWMVACSFMSGAEWAENIVNNVEEPLDAKILFSMVLLIDAGEDVADCKQRHNLTKAKAAS